MLVAYLFLDFGLGWYVYSPFVNSLRIVRVTLGLAYTILRTYVLGDVDDINVY